MELSLVAMPASFLVLVAAKSASVGGILSQPGHMQSILLWFAVCLLFLTSSALWAMVPGRRRSKKDAELKDRYRSMIEETTDLIHIVSPDGKFLYVNEAWRKTFGYSEEEISRLNQMELLHPEEREKARSNIQQLMAKGGPIQIETRFITKAGRTVWVEGNSTCEFEKGMVVSRRGIFHDVTARLEGEEERARLLALLEEAPDFIASIAPDGRVLWVNRAFRQLRQLGPAPDFSGLRLSDFHPAWARDSLGRAIPVASSSGIWNGESAVLDVDGREIPVSQTIAAHRNESGEVAYLSTVCRDITESRRAEQALREAHSQINLVLQREKELARTDVLTGLANRRSFYESLQMERSRTVRYGRPITLAYVDLDNFKRVNDTLGHSVGDELLVCVASLLRNTLRASDLVGRLGGDEFAVLLPETGAQAAESLLQKLALVLNDAMRARNWPVTFSIGAAAFLDNPVPVEEMIRTADELMYSVKKSGKNRISVALMGGAWHEPPKAPLSKAEAGS